jgi:hypothetical protein
VKLAATTTTSFYKASREQNLSKGDFYTTIENFINVTSSAAACTLTTRNNDHLCLLLTHSLVSQLRRCCVISTPHIIFIFIRNASTAIANASDAVFLMWDENFLHSNFTVDVVVVRRPFSCYFPLFFSVHSIFSLASSMPFVCCIFMLCPSFIFLFVLAKKI